MFVGNGDLSSPESLDRRVRNDVSAKSDRHNEETGPALSDRERTILRFVVEAFVDSAGPVGSRTLAKESNLNLSAASIRNTMADLEDMGYLDHPYTSAGRVPTRLGYRTFVDDLMDTPELSPVEKQVLELHLAQLKSEANELLQESTRLLSKLSNLLGIALSPRLSSGVLDRIDIVPLSDARLMFVLSVRGGLVKTIVLEFMSDVRRSKLDRVVSILNERLAGLTLREIRDTHEERMKDLRDDTGLLQLIMEESTLLFSEPEEGRLQFDGTQNILSQPEFQEPDQIRRLIETIEDEDRVVNVLEDLFESDPNAVGQATVRIGRAEDEDEMDAYSIVTSPYQLGDTIGTVGVIGPPRMDYARAVALVENAAHAVNRPSDEAGSRTDAQTEGS